MMRTSDVMHGSYKGAGGAGSGPFSMLAYHVTLLHSLSGGANAKPGADASDDYRPGDFRTRGSPHAPAAAAGAGASGGGPVVRPVAADRRGNDDVLSDSNRRPGGAGAGAHRAGGDHGQRDQEGRRRHAGPPRRQH